jgi:hypothetical protein
MVQVVLLLKQWFRKLKNRKRIARESNSQKNKAREFERAWEILVTLIVAGVFMKDRKG